MESHQQKKNYEEPSDSRRRHTGLFPGACQTRHVPWTIHGLCWFKSLRRSTSRTTEDFRWVSLP